MSKIFTLAEELIKEYREATSGLTIANTTLNDINHEAEFMCPSLAEKETVGLVAEYRDCILLCTNDMCDEDIDFID